MCLTRPQPDHSKFLFFKEDDDWPLRDPLGKYLEYSDYTILEKAPVVVLGATELKEWVTPIVTGLDEILRHHRCHAATKTELLFQITEFLSSPATMKELVTRTKYVLNFPMSRYLRNPEPSCSSELRLTGRARRWFRNRINAYNKRNTHLWYSWLNVKRCANPLPEEMIPEILQDHFDALSSADVDEDMYIDLIMKSPTFNKILSEIGQRLESAYFREKVREFFPSVSACFEAKRGESYIETSSSTLCGNGGGALGFIRRSLGNDGCNFAIPELRKMDFLPRASSYEKRVRNACVSLYETPSYALNEAKNSHLSELSQKDYLPAMIKIVFEPLKARIISKGSAFPYFCAKPLQSALWKILKDYPCFELISRTASPTDLIPLASRPGKWFSVDYKASTDNLSWKYSERIISKLCSYTLCPEISLLFEKVLGPHRLCYKIDDSCPTAPLDALVLQRRGQLMGSILSFPILCLANLGLYCRVVDSLGPPSSFEERISQVIVNGDDMLYKASREEFDFHSFLGTKVGLTLSEGKVYYHDYYCNINSTCFDFKGNCPREIPFYNCALLFGKHKVQSKNTTGPDVKRLPVAEMHDAHAQISRKLTEGPEDWKVEIACNMNTVLNGLYFPDDSSRIIQKCISINSEKISSDCRGLMVYKGKETPFSRNLFLPVFLGGLGVHPPKDFQFRITPSQQLVASNILSSYPDSFWDVRPTRVRESSKIRTMSVSPLFRYVQNPEVPKFQIVRKYRARKSLLRLILPSILVGAPIV